MSGRSPAPAPVSGSEWARMVLELRAKALRERHRGVRVRVAELRDGHGLEAEDGGWLVIGTAGEVEAALAERATGTGDDTAARRAAPREPERDNDQSGRRPARL